MEQLTKAAVRTFAAVVASDDGVMMKQIQATHVPDGRDIDVKSVIFVIEGIMRHVTPNVDADHDVYIFACSSLVYVKSRILVISAY